MGSQSAVEDSATRTPRPLPGARRSGRPGTPLMPDALGRAADRSDRLAALTRELRAAGGQGRTSAWLAQRLNVSARTVKRDVMALQQAGVPIRASSGPQGGYTIDTSAIGPPLHLTTGEAIALVVALQAVPDQPFDASARALVSKVLRSLDAGQRDEVVRVAGHVWVRPGEPPPVPDEAGRAVRQVLVRGLREHQVVIVDYRPGDSDRTETRQVEPLGFAFTHGQWVVLTWSRDDDAGWWYALDRITGAQPTHERFEPRDVREVFGQASTGSGVTP